MLGSCDKIVIDALTMSLRHAFRAAVGLELESCVVQLLDKQRVRSRPRDRAGIGTV